MADSQLSGRQLILGGIAAMAAAGIAFVVFILPAEFNRDPTGLGEAMGIAGMSGYSVGALAQEDAAYSTDAVTFELAPFESIEYKYALLAGQSMLYQWSAEDRVYFDFHSEEAGRDPEDAVTFAIGETARADGTYVAPFDGIHGWFWENRGSAVVVVRLETTGYYSTATTYGPSGAYTRRFGDEASQ